MSQLVILNNFMVRMHDINLTLSGFKHELKGKACLKNKYSIFLIQIFFSITKEFGSKSIKFKNQTKLFI